MAKILVVGGAGYVGSTTCAWLQDQRHDVWVLDDLSTGVFELVLTQGQSDRFVFGQAGDEALVSQLLEKVKFDCVLHFAARSLVSESFLYPKEYHENNVLQTERLVHVLLKAGVRNFIFSSTCAVFGNPGDVPIHEQLAKSPVNPYGQSKLDVERILEKLAQTHSLHAIALRYFNAAGAEPQMRVGEWHEPETHLIPKILKAAIQGQPLEIYGTDYSTPDGTCIRDYVHVWDLAQAHGAAVERLLSRNQIQEGVFEAYNLGSGRGFSVKEMVAACEEVTGQKLTVIEKERRPGDPARLVANSDLAQKVLQFKQDKGNLKEILSSAWEWEKKKARLLRRAVFLDRDGTLNEDPGYIHDPTQVKLYASVGEALALLKAAGYLLVIVSNQSGVGRGLIAQENIPLIHARFDELLKAWKVNIKHYALCFHRPEDDCDCRKPKPKLILDTAHLFGIDLSCSYMIGDRISDLAAGYAAGCRGSILVRTGEGSVTANQLQRGQAAFVCDTLLQAAEWILGNEDS